MINFNFKNILLLAGLIASPIAGLMLHLRLHSDLVYLTYILWFDITIISLLYLFNKTRFIGFILNTVFFLVGVIMHFTYLGIGGIGDILLAIPGLAIGYILWRDNLEFIAESKVPIKKFKKKIK